MLPDLRILGFALRLRWEWQKRAPDAPAWTRLPARPGKLVDAMCQLFGGTAPQLLFRAVGKRYLKTPVKDAMFQHRWVWVRHISGARTAAVLYEYIHLWEKLESVQLRLLEGNRFVWRWTPDGSSAYRSLFLGMYVVAPWRHGGMEGFGATQGQVLFSGSRCTTASGRPNAE